jgi:hypothetical protein
MMRSYWKPKINLMIRSAGISESEEAVTIYFVVELLVQPWKNAAEQRAQETRSSLSLQPEGVHPLILPELQRTGHC